MQQYTVMNTSVPGKWEEGIPVGNGRMGAMLLCGVGEETLYLNEESIWSSHPCGVPNPAMAEKLAAIRQLFLDGKPAEGDKLAKESFRDCFSRIRSYESAGKLRLFLHDTDRCKHYKHELDLVNGVATVSYEKDGSHYTRECFASYPDDVIVYKVTSSNAPICATLFYEREHTLSVTAEGNTLCAVGKTVYGDHRFCVKARILTDGTVTACDGELRVSQSRSFCVLITLATAFRHADNFCDAAVFPDRTGYDLLCRRHCDDFSALMSRSEIRIPNEPEAASLSTYERFRLFRFDEADPGGLTMLQWQFGKYLLISSSRPGTLPANLQGLWVKGLANDWSADYHTNINLQANYWAAETVNLSQCHLPLLDYMNQYLLESGKETARIGYRTRGCVVHHLSDIYGFTTPADGLWGIWPHGASWLSYHMWEHYLFTQDLTFLRDSAYEFIRQSAIFFLENLVEDKDGFLIYGPSASPENQYWVQDENGEPYACYLTLNSTMDLGIIGGLFRNYLDASALLGIEDRDVQAVRAAKEKLPPFRIGKFGQLQEWCEDYEETQPGHFHISHSFALFPDCAINRSTPELMQAMNVTINRRMGGGYNVSGYGALNVGWSLGWLMVLLSRLRRGEDAYGMIPHFLIDCVGENLLDISAKCFQIDGNMAFVAGVAEMLLQSHEGVIALIPALPKDWDHGSFRGLCARGDYTLDLTWQNYEVKEFTVSTNETRSAVIELPPTQVTTAFRDEAGNLHTAVNGLLDLSVPGRIHLRAVESPA